MAYQLSKRSRARLSGVHPALVRVVERAIEITEIDFAVLEGLRNMTQQERLVAKGASTTLRSRHLTGHAVDLGAYVDGAIRWDWPLYHQLAAAMKQAAQELGVVVEWGGDWMTFPDGPHFQLPWALFPARVTQTEAA